MIAAADRRKRGFVDRFGTFPLNTGLVEPGERANIQFRARQPRNRRLKIEACGAHRQRCGAHQLLQFANQFRRRSIARTYICDERQRAIGAARPSRHGHISNGCVRAKHGLDSIEIDAKPAYLDLPILAADSLQQPVGPLAREVSGAKNPLSMRGVRFNALVREPSLDPTSQRNVLSSDDELTDFAWRRSTTVFVN